MQNQIGHARRYASGEIPRAGDFIVGVPVDVDNSPPVVALVARVIPTDLTTLPLMLEGWHGEADQVVTKACQAGASTEFPEVAIVGGNLGRFDPKYCIRVDPLNQWGKPAINTFMETAMQQDLDAAEAEEERLLARPGIARPPCVPEMSDDAKRFFSEYSSRTGDPLNASDVVRAARGVAPPLGKSAAAPAALVEPVAEFMAGNIESDEAARRIRDAGGLNLGEGIADQIGEDYQSHPDEPRNRRSCLNMDSPPRPPKPAPPQPHALGFDTPRPGAAFGDLSDGD